MTNSLIQGCKSILIVAILSIAFLNQCKHKPIYRAPIAEIDTINYARPDDSTICFERDILPLFETNCSRQGNSPTPVCHNATYKWKGFELYKYDGITADIKSVMDKIKNGDMNNTAGKGSYGRLNTAQINLIQKWINQGSPNSTFCPDRCDSSKYTYAKNIVPILWNCYGCHRGTLAGGGVILDNYTSIKALVDNKKLWNAINNLPGAVFMPKGGKKLNKCELMKIKKWIDHGAKNN
jgi:hypothetical protein